MKSNNSSRQNSHLCTYCRRLPTPIRRPQPCPHHRSNLINYLGELTTCTADLTTTKILWNSTISMPGARFPCTDIENMYLQTPMDRYEYMRIKADLLPDAFKDAYNL
eukprot:CCRYP_006827-RA/>CCRYP_006827-RA protein AED:0.45 eAED:0.45 QI:0/0/0/1/0/0/2/0/106